MSNGRRRAEIRRTPVWRLAPSAVAAAAVLVPLALTSTAPAQSRAAVTLAAETHRGVEVSRSAARTSISVAATEQASAAAHPKPTAPAAPAGLNFAPCGSSSVERGLQPGAVRLYRAVCNAFPGQIKHFGGLGAGEHANGKAIDFMVYGNAALGQNVATFLRAHAYELGLYDIIWQQHIWTPVRAGEGWRQMANRGSATANHYDHVHSSVN